MTYTILSLASGSTLSSYRSEERVLEAAARICSSEPAAAESIAVLTFDDAGQLVETVDGAELSERLQLQGHAAQPA